MMVSLLFVIVLGLLPLGVYLTWLAGLHRRPGVTTISGPSDFALMLGGLVGFLPVLGALALLALQSNARLLLRLNGRQAESVWAEERVEWLVTVALFLLAVGGAVGLTALARRRSLAVYNIDRAELERVVREVLTGLGLAAARFGNVWGDGRAILAVEPVEGLRYATVRLLTADPRLREELDRNLRARLAGSPGARGGAAGWFSAAGTTCLGAALAALALLMYIVYFMRL